MIADGRARLQPSSASTSEIKVINSTFTEGTINISIVDTALNCPDPSHSVFSLFSTSALLFVLTYHIRVSHCRVMCALGVCGCSPPLFTAPFAKLVAAPNENADPCSRVLQIGT